MARTVWGDPIATARPTGPTSCRWPVLRLRQRTASAEDGYLIIGRMDDVIKVSGYRLGTAEVESALVSHPSVAEAAVIGVPDELRGHAIHAFCILKSGETGDLALTDALKAHVRHEVGPIAVPAVIEIVESLPKTRSGKIMRRLLKARVMGQPAGDTSTLEG